MSNPDNTFPAYIESTIFRDPVEGWIKAYFNTADDYDLAVRDPSTIRDEQYYDHPYHPPFFKEYEDAHLQVFNYFGTMVSFSPTGSVPWLITC